MQETLARARAGEADPPCRECGGILKSDTISFGQALNPQVIERAMADALLPGPIGIDLPLVVRGVG